MADEDAAAQSEGSRWALDAADDAPLPAAFFEAPAGWSDAIEWPPIDGEIVAPVAESAAAATVATVAPVAPAVNPFAEVAPSVNSFAEIAQPVAPVADVVHEVAPFPEVVADVAAPPAPAPDVDPYLFFGHTVAAPVIGGDADFQLEPLPDSIWAPEAALGEAHTVVPVADASAPAFYAEAERHRSGRPERRFHLRHTNAAFIGLVAFVSLVLLGLFFSVRNRSDIASTEAAQHPPTAGNIGAQGLPVLTLPTTSVVPGVSLADLLAPGSTAAADPGATADATTPPSVPAPSGATTTPTRAAAPSGGNSTPQTTPTTATTATTATTVSQPTTTQPPVTSPPDSSPDTTQAPVATTQPRPTVTSPTVPVFTVPSIPFPTATTPTTRGHTPLTGLG